jgi:hypothetical protein
VRRSKQRTQTTGWVVELIIDGILDRLRPVSRKPTCMTQPRCRHGSTEDGVSQCGIAYA